MQKPRLSTTVMVLSPILLVALGFCIWLVLGEPWVFSNNTDMDIGGGDLRDQVCVFCIPLKGRVYESALSRELRRLGMAVPVTRTWKRIGQSYLVQRRSISYGYRRVLLRCDELLSTLDEVRVPDDERRMVLQKLMTSLRTEDARRAWWQVCLLRDEVAGKRGLHVFSPEFEEELRKLRGQGQPQTPAP